MAGSPSWRLTVNAAPVSREDGLVVREATTDDLDGIATLCSDHLGEREGANVRTVFSPAFDWMPAAAVVVDGERVVSTMLLVLHRLRIGEVVLPAAQVEWVATSTEYRNRGLVRDQLRLLHRHAEGAGVLVEFIIGIPYFYRRVGYEYAMPWPPAYRWPRDVEVADGIEVRAATLDDTEAIMDLDSRARSSADVTIERTAGHWRWILEHTSESEQCHVALRDGQLVAYARSVPDDGEVSVADCGGDDPDAVTAVLAAAANTLEASNAWALSRPHPPVALACAKHGIEDLERTGIYARLPDTLAFLEALRPELTRRLAASHWSSQTGELTISTYRAGYRLTYDEGEITAVEAVEPLMYPISQGGIGVPEDRLPELLLGRRAPADLEASVDDVLFGRHRDLVGALFPRLRYDPLMLML